jgi:hypothetical protein
MGRGRSVETVRVTDTYFGHTRTTVSAKKLRFGRCQYDVFVELPVWKLHSSDRFPGRLCEDFKGPYGMVRAMVMLSENPVVSNSLKAALSALEQAAKKLGDREAKKFRKL